MTAGGLYLAAPAIANRVLGPLPLERTHDLSISVLDRHDRLLRAFITPDGRWRLGIQPADVDPRYLKMLITYEDKRFYRHGGIDPMALLRAAGQLVRRGHIVSGGSTLTMQVARLVDGGQERSLAAKLRQMLRALQLEATLSKTDIVRLYLRLAPFGGNVEGVRAASLAYLGKEPRRLSAGEAALLVALPQSPEQRRPDRYPQRAQKARDRVLERIAAAGVVSPGEVRAAKAETVPKIRREFPRYAAHLSEDEVRRYPDRSIHRLTLDRDLQAALEALAQDHTRQLGARLSAAIVALDHTTGEVLAQVGSAGYLADDRFGAVDMTRAIRSPGSTLKPLIYGLAFEAGLAHPQTLIEDRPVRFGVYAPKNFDQEFHGTVTIRSALAQSLNIPAVKVLNALGPARLTSRFRRAGIAVALPGLGEPTLAMALGGVGLTIIDLATVYAAIARGGDVIELRHDRDPQTVRAIQQGAAARKWLRRRLLTPVAAWYLTDILKNAAPPLNAQPGIIAYKTGTSFGFQDAWAIGYDGRHTIAVWVGRPDATATPGLTGRTAAAPLLFEAFARISPRRVPFGPPPSGVVRATGSDLPPPLRRFNDDGINEAAAAGPYLDPAVHIAFPPDRAELEVGAEAGEPATLVVKAEGGTLPLTWLIDGKPVDAPNHVREITVSQAGRGFVKLSVIDAHGRADRVTVRLK